MENNDEEVLISMIDTIELFIQEASTADDSTQCQLLLQTDSFFRKVIKINQESPEFSRLINCIQSFFQLLNSHLAQFLSDKKRSQNLADLLIFFSNSSIISQIANDISAFTTALLLSSELNEENVNNFTEFLHVFFTSPAFPQSFESTDGLISLWKLLMNESKVNIFEKIFSDLQQTINLYFQSTDSEKSKEFFTIVIETTKDIPTSNATRAFQFINDLITASQSKLLIPFIDQGGFKSFNQYIIEHNDPDLLVLYHIFMSMCTSPNVLPKFTDEVHPIFGELIKLFEFHDISEAIQKKAMSLLYNSLSVFPREYCPIQSENIYVIASSIKPDQKESALLLFQMSHYLMTHFDFDITLTIPLFFPFYDYHFFVENNVQNLFEVLKMSEDSFLPFVPLFFSSITKNITPEQFFDLIEKYPTLLEFMDVYVNDNIFDDHLLTLFYSISPLFKERKMYSKVLIQVLMNEERVDFLFKFLTEKEKDFSDSILNEIAQLFCYSKKLRNSPHSINFLNKMNFDHISPSTIFNVVIGLSGKFFNQKLDTFLIQFLKKHDFFNMTKDNIKKLAFGIFQNDSSSSGHLIFPSLLPFCGDDIKIVHSFDKWICGQYGIDLWLSETGQSIDKFPSIESVANCYLLPKHASLLLEYPKVINECCSNSFQDTPCFEFGSNLQNTMISFTLSETVRALSFWFSINELPTEKVRIVSFFNCNLVMENNMMTLNESESCTVAANRWYHVVLIANEKLTTCTGHVNGKQAFQCNLTQDSNNNTYSCFDSDYDEITFSNENSNLNNNNNSAVSKYKMKPCCLKFGNASMNPIQWYIGGAIRVYSQVIQNDTIESLLASGVSNIIKNVKPSESFFITANNFVELFEVINQNLSNRYLSENSRPTISFPFLRHLQNAYNGGQCILNLISKRLENDEDEKENESIGYLLDSLCKMQNLQFTNWKLSVFAVHMSTLFYLRPSLFNENILNNLFSCFSSDINDSVSWDDVLVFIFDFGLFNTSNRGFVISKLFEFVAKCNCDENISSNLLNFIFHVLFFFDKELKDSEYDMLISMIDKYHPTSNQISYMLQARLNFNENLVNPTFQYDKELFEGRLYEKLYDMFIKTVDDKFCDYHLIYILQPSHSIELIGKIVHSITKKKIPSNRVNQIIFFCLSHSEIKESWPILLNLLLTVKSKKLAGQYIESIETLILNSQIDSESLYILVIALSFLSIHVLNQPEEELKSENNFWMNLWIFLYSFTFSNASMFNSDILSSKKVFSSILQLISLGFFTSEKVIFPFCPSIENPEEIMKYSIMSGQPFPSTPGTNLIRANATYKPKSGNDVYSSISRIIPPTYHLPPPYSESTISSHKKMYDISFVNKVLDVNKNKIVTNWHNFIPKQNYSVETALKSTVFKDIINFVVKICSNLKLIDPKSNMKRSASSNSSLSLLDNSSSSSALISIDSSSILIMNDDNNNDDNIDEQADLASQNVTMDFNRFFINIISLTESINTKYSMKLISIFTIEILNHLITKKKTALFILRFICRRISSGWYEREYLLELITNILSVPIKGKEKTMNNILQILIFVSKNIPQENFNGFLKLFNTQSEKIFNSINYELDWFIVLLFDFIYSNKDNQEIIKTTKTFADTLKQSCKRIKDKNVLQMRNEILNGILELNNPSYEPNEYLKKLISEKKEEFITTISKSIVNSLVQDSIYRTTQTAHFYQSMNEFLDVFNTFDVCARSISSIVRFNDRRLLLFDLNCFFRLREKVLTSFPFSDNSTFKEKIITKTVSLLNDPINPTRRFEKSPVIYNIPPFPSVSKNVVSVMPYPLPNFEDILNVLPESLYDLLSIDYLPFEAFVLHQLKPSVLSFSYHFESDEALLFSMVLNFVTREKKAKLKFIGDASILYGVSPLKGVLIIDSKNMYFLEGLKLTNDGCTFKDNINHDMNDIIYEFYISYMDAGYFGQPYIFEGHPLIQIPMSQIILSTPHLWLQKEIAFELNFLLGWAFIIVAKNNDDYLTLSKCLNECVDHNFGKYHIYNKYPSPINNARILRQSIRDVSRLWVDGHISNNTYLLYLNKIAGRSFIDFSQFNVFPWIISDYSTSLYESIPAESFRDLSLPMGQIGPERTPRFQLFFETSKYFYGTHYMHLGVVLFYLFRIDPFCLFSIYFHHGWDHPSRLFSDFAEAWLSAAHVSQNDVKEAVPQLFKCPEFLLNISNLPLTMPESNPPTPQNVENVKLGRWSNNSRDFTRIMSIELESERVSKSINNWIDLIFGVKSRGEPAIEAKNVFPPLCYSDNASTTTNANANANSADERNLIEEEVERKAAEASIINFGQCPRQLFKSSHPIKNKIEPRAHLLSDPRLIFYQSLNCNAFIPSALPANDVYIGSQNIFIAPQNGLVLNSTTTIQFSYDMSSIVSYSNNVYNSISVAKAKFKAKAKTFGRSNQRSNSYIRDESTDDDDTDDEDDSQMRLFFNSTSSSPIMKSFFPASLDETQQLDSSLSSSYQDFSNLVASIDNSSQPKPSPLTMNQGENIGLNQGINSPIQTSSSATIDFASNSRMKVLFKCPDSVDFICKSPDGSLVSLFLKEGSFTVYSLHFEKGEVKGGSKLMWFSTPSSEVITAAISSVHFLAIIVCNDEMKGKRICRFDLGLMIQVDPIEAGFSIQKVVFDDNAATIIACGEEEMAVFTVSGQMIVHQKMNGLIENSDNSEKLNDVPEKVDGENKSMKITAIAVANLEEHIENRFFVTGHVDGFVRFWFLDLNKAKIVLLKDARVCNTQIDLVSIATDDDSCFEANGNALRAIVISSRPISKMFSFEFYASAAKNLRKEYAVRCAICGKRFDEIKQKPNVCYGCHRFFCKDCSLKADKKMCKNCQDLKNKLAEEAKDINGPS